MENLSNVGVRCTIENETRSIKCYVLCCCVDSAVRPPMQGLVQYNGYYGCIWCLHPNYYVHYNRCSCIKYIVLDYVPPCRTEQESIYFMERSLTSQHSVFGLKQPSVLINLSYFNIISGFFPDSMHCINLGIAEQFLNY